MQRSELRLIKHALEYIPKDDFLSIPLNLRGIYVLYQKVGKNNAESHHYNFVYIGMASNNIRGRIRKHKEQKGNLWSHFSIFEVWDNISDEEIAELEGLFRHLYKYDSKANALNQQKGYAKLTRIRKQTEKEWYQ
ncbi:MAG: GIY-YIG nuclease family protein [Candidatus Thiodiazotropha endolucinida]|uniref:GIY-YIG nuclease family protein n=1 Tax=Candidatus Thiodiazotropha taylori TaxID=2792791 RepID=A0A9E4NNT9_9GAMM|nr:GIY-YIG nuclease family protein [Candidatus Thiodiazotropha taylori]MCW4238417.1 GIY-YIG nuclease family protein [Candidatus Thiodiazotropha endolucinida]